MRAGAPEIIYCASKTADQIQRIISDFQKTNMRSTPLILSRLGLDHATYFSSHYPELRYFEDAAIALLGKNRPKISLQHKIAVITAGTSDISVANEAAILLEALGHTVVRIFDVGVAGIHRIMSRQDVLREACVCIVVAGMDGALPSVVAGLTPAPVVAVPTSVGYGASFGGVAALLSMLNTCAPGLAVVNIDNGIGAGVFAHKMVQRILNKHHTSSGPETAGNET